VHARQCSRRVDERVALSKYSRGKRAESTYRALFRLAWTRLDGLFEKLPGFRFVSIPREELWLPDRSMGNLITKRRIFRRERERERDSIRIDSILTLASIQARKFFERGVKEMYCNLPPCATLRKLYFMKLFETENLNDTLRFPAFPSQLGVTRNTCKRIAGSTLSDA